MPNYRGRKITLEYDGSWWCASYEVDGRRDVVCRPAREMALWVSKRHIDLEIGVEEEESR